MVSLGAASRRWRARFRLQASLNHLARTIIDSKNTSFPSFIAWAILDTGSGVVAGLVIDSIGLGAGLGLLVLPSASSSAGIIGVAPALHNGSSDASAARSSHTLTKRTMTERDVIGVIRSARRDNGSIGPSLPAQHGADDSTVDAGL